MTKLLALRPTVFMLPVGKGLPNDQHETLRETQLIILCNPYYMIILIQSNKIKRETLKSLYAVHQYNNSLQKLYLALKHNL